MPSTDNLVLFALIYTAIGATIWMLLYGLGLVDYQRRAWAARGQELSATAFVLAILMVIVLWPKFVVAYFRSRRVRR